MNVIAFKPQSSARIIIETGIDTTTQDRVWLLTYIDEDGHSLCVADRLSAEAAYRAAGLWVADGARVVDKTDYWNQTVSDLIEPPVGST